MYWTICHWLINPGLQNYKDMISLPDLFGGYKDEQYIYPWAVGIGLVSLIWPVDANGHWLFVTQCTLPIKTNLLLNDITSIYSNVKLQFIYKVFR